MSEFVRIRNWQVPVYEHHTLVVGSGAAGLNAAALLARQGLNCALITEGMNMGTSRNTGSDKQTYYKLTLSGGVPDSVWDMARTLFEGGSMHGDLALVEAACSVQAFSRLTNLGVPFPQNEFGEFVGYKTDHDPRSRATSCGPLTSRFMTEALEKELCSLDVPLYDHTRVVEIITHRENFAGLLAVCPDNISSENPAGLVLFKGICCVWATGGPSAIYASTVYPESQTCAHGTAFRACVRGVNLTESQYGIASVKFRWNLSGTYQQVVPCYFSTADDGHSDRQDMLAGEFDRIFLKGYQWPFDPRKLEGSSAVDMEIYRQRQLGRRVFMDFRQNAAGFSMDALGEEARNYLVRSGAHQDTPIARLRHMNEPAYQLYLSHGIDLEQEPLEIDVCAQHNNGGLAGDIHYQTNISGLFAVGEVNGVFGVYRPGGSALNSTQVSSMRAVRHILDDFADRSHLPICPDSPLLNFWRESDLTAEEILQKRKEYGLRMSKCGAFVREEGKIREAIHEIFRELIDFPYGTADPELFRELTINYDILITQLCYLNAILAYIVHGGGSRGSYLIEGSELDTTHSGVIESIVLEKDFSCKIEWESVRPIPDSEQWFETVYNRCRNN